MLQSDELKLFEWILDLLIVSYRFCQSVALYKNNSWSKYVDSAFIVVFRATYSRVWCKITIVMLLGDDLLGDGSS